MSQWKKLGLIFKPDQSLDWMQSHAQLPTALHLENDLFRIYFASRNKENISQIGYFEIDIKEPNKIINYTKEPIVKNGDIGFFDEHGVYPSSMIKVNDKHYMYYIGWNKGHEAPLFYASIGLAISEDGGLSFKKYSKAPIMSRSEHDPCLVTAPSVYKIDGREGYHMLYTSGYKWAETEEKELKSFYNVKYAYSQDGVSWQRNGRIVLELNPEESNIARASVTCNNNYYIFSCYSKNGSPYQLLEAESKDGYMWERKEFLPKIPVNTRDFDSEMQAYPFFIIHNNKKYLFYNGNSFGKEGLGLAILEER